MPLASRVACVAAIALILVSATATAQEPEPQQDLSVKFLDINDAVPSKFFDAAGSAPDTLDPNTLRIAFNTGLDPKTWKYNDFRASTAAYSHVAAMDTISFRVIAPEDHYISKITYRQYGSGSIVRTGQARGGSSWVVDDYAAELGMFGTNPTLTREVELTGYRTMVPVSISIGLFAFATPSLGSATLSVTSAEIQVHVLKRPVAPTPE